MNNTLRIAGNMASYDRFQKYESAMLEKYKDYWVESEDIQGLHELNSRMDLKEKALQKIGNIAGSFFNIILEKFYFYETKKETIPYVDPIEKQLNDCAMDNMSRMYSQQMMNPLYGEVLEIKKTYLKVHEHFEQFKALCGEVEDQSVAKEKAANLIKEMHAARRNLNRHLFSLSHKSQQLIDKVKSLTDEGKDIGPSFNQNPAVFVKLNQCPIVMSTSKYINKGIKGHEMIEIIEGIKQTRSVANEVEPFYLLFLNAVQAMRKMEKGMSLSLAKRYRIQSGFELASPPKDKALKSDRKTCSSSFDVSSAKFELAMQKAEIFDVLAGRKKVSIKPSGEVSSIPKIVSECLGSFLPHMTCSLSNELFKEPVIIETGHTFEKSEIEKHFENHDTCPITQKVLTSKELINNYAIKSIVQRFAGCPEDKKADFFSQIPEFASSISYELFNHPTVVSSGITYEKEEIPKFGVKCPMTNLELNPDIQIPNLALAALMGSIFGPHQK